MKPQFEFLKTLKGKTALLLLTFICVFLFFSVFIYFQNSKLSKLYLRSIAANQVEALAMGQFRLFNSTQVYMTEKIIYPSVSAPFERTILEQLKSLSTDATSELVANFSALESGFSVEGKMDTVQQAWAQLHATALKIKSMKDEIVASDSLSSVKYAELTNYYRNSMDDISLKFSVMYYIVYEIAMPTKEATRKELDKTINIIVASVIIITIITVVVCLLTYSSLRKALQISLEKSNRLIGTLSKGEIPKAEVPTKDELGPIIAGANQLAERMSNASEFAIAIGQGKFDSSFVPLSERDVLGNALLGMRNDLKLYKEKEVQQNWLATGIARFSDLLRNNADSVTEISYKIINELVKYLRANQGSVFVYNKESNVLELQATYAYERRKYITKAITPGEGLVGQCFLEGQKIVLTNIPKGYIEITSGLGNATPNMLLIVPIKIEDEIEGVIELASFNQFKPYEIELIEKVAQNIGSVFMNIYKRVLTEQLLVKSQQQAEEMRAQEEEMRQNMEEMSATHEEFRNREQTYVHKIQQLQEQIKSIQNNVKTIDMG